MTALYIHIPFCKRKCAYCDFVSFAGCESRWGAYLLALEDEMKQAARTYGRLDLGSVFIGGGTPSLLDSDAVMHLLAMTRALFRPASDAEITVECNPGTLTPEKLRDYRASGVNRLSLGMQAAQQHLLDMLGRIHTQAEVIQSLDWAHQAGFDNVNLDLMYALPGQSMADWVDTVKQAMALKPTHLSMYSLILEDGTPLKDRVDRGELCVPDDETCVNMQHAAQRMVSRRGYERYEISNYALPGFASRHNMTYWTRGDYLGLGVAAHSFMRGERFADTTDLDAYLAGTRCVSRAAVTDEEAFEEAVMLGTRLTCGINLALLSGREKAVQRLTEAGFAEICDGRFRLTDKGMDVQDAVVLKLLED